MSRNKPACLNKKVPLTSLSHWHWKLITQYTRSYDASPEKTSPVLLDKEAPEGKPFARQGDAS